MNFCLDFARENRNRILLKFMDIVADQISGIKFGESLDVHHNYAAEEKHFGQEVIVHRKGAVRAVGKVIIPGSMGSPSYIAEGLANPDSFQSCSHGAGRVMSRTKALNTLDLIAVRNKMGNTVCNLRTSSLDEAPQCYKDIDVVMQNQADLVTPVHKLRPLAVVKG